jgi:hypothetical protein
VHELRSYAAPRSQTRAAATSVRRDGDGADDDDCVRDRLATSSSSRHTPLRLPSPNDTPMHSERAAPQLYLRASPQARHTLVQLDATASRARWTQDDAHLT